MGWIATWLSEQTQAGMADLVVEDTLTDLKRREKLLDKYIPFETYRTREFLAYVVEEINTLASVMPYGVEPPVTQHGTFRKITAELLKTGLSYLYDEERQWEMKRAMEEAMAKKIMVMDIPDPVTGEVIRGTNNDLAKYLFGTIERIAASQVEVLNFLTWQALQTGAIDYTDPRTGAKVTLDYRNPNDTSYNHFPSALSGADAWDQYATANGIRDLYNDIETYLDTNGYRPSAIVMSHRLRNHLMQQQATKDSASSLTVTQVGTVSPDMLGKVLEARDLPPIITFDEQYQNEYDNKQTYKARFLNDNRYVFLTEGMGQRAMGPTIESDGAEGVYVATREVSKFPSVDATQAVATILPVFPDPKKMFARQAKAA